MEASLRNQILALAEVYPQRQSALMPALYKLQLAAGGHLPAADLRELATLLGVSVAHAYGVASYYSMFNLKPIGKYHLQVDTNIPGLLVGADTIVRHICKSLGIKVGQTTNDGMFTLTTVEDLASCATCPVVQVNDKYFERMTPAKVDELLSSLRKGIVPQWTEETSFSSECNILLRRRGRSNSTSLDTYVADGGYRALEKALAQAPGEIVHQVTKSNLRGLGGAGFPVGAKWSFLPHDTRRPVYLICNADEGEPGTFKDRQIMEFDPHLLIEGMVISAYATGAALGFIYIRGEFAWIAARLNLALAEAKRAGKLGCNIMGSGFDFDVIVHLGAGAYVCGEETALIESLEGKRGNPRHKPPFPAIAGLYGCPTTVSNVETLACIPFIVEQGAEAFRAIGTPNNSGPKIFGVSGHVRKPGVYEFPLGTPLTRVLEAAGGVVGKLKAVIVGGLTTPLLTAAEAEGLLLDYDSCQKSGTLLGSGGIIVMNESVSIPRIALRTSEFHARESCGQCTPCREGGKVLRHLLQKQVQGHGTEAELEMVLRLANQLKMTTLCPGGAAFLAPIAAMISKFREEFLFGTSEGAADDMNMETGEAATYASGVFRTTQEFDGWRNYDRR